MSHSRREDMAPAGASNLSTSSPSPSSFSSPAPKILLAKPGLIPGVPSAPKFILGGGGGREDDSASIRSRLPPIGSLNLLSDSCDFHFDRFLTLLSENNTDFTVVGVIGPPGAGKSTIMNEIYGFDPTTSGMLPPFAIRSEETRVNARHCTIGIEPRVTSERIILLDTQPVLSASILAEMTRPDGSSTVSVLSGENLSAELALEVMGIQIGVFLASVCHIIIVVSEGIHDSNMWHLMSTVDMLKHNIPDPSSLTVSIMQSSTLGTEKESKDKYQAVGEEYIAAPVFVHTKLHDGDLSLQNFNRVGKALARYFNSSSFVKTESKSTTAAEYASPSATNNGSCRSSSSSMPPVHLIPCRSKDGTSRACYECCDLALTRLRDQVLSMRHPKFSRSVTEREWLKNATRIWELVKNSPIIAEYCKMLQNSGLFRR
ncbi:hypothetical protein Droror1_Dr00009366 [Drosera rotundifolia]